MTFSGGLNVNNASNTVSTNVTKTAGSLTMCSGGCAGAGNVTFYGGGSVSPSSAPAQAAGLSYNFNTGTNLVQGVAVFKR